MRNAFTFMSDIYTKWHRRSCYELNKVMRRFPKTSFQVHTCITTALCQISLNIFMSSLHTQPSAQACFSNQYIMSYSIKTKCNMTAYCSTYSHFRTKIRDNKSSPITGPRCPEGSRKLRFPDYMTVAQDGGKVVSLTYQPLFTPGNALGTHFY